MAHGPTPTDGSLNFSEGQEPSITSATNIEDYVPKHVIDFMARPQAAQFKAIAMNIKNPQIFAQFIALESDAPIWDYAYAAGLISKADRDSLEQSESVNPEMVAPLNPGTIDNSDVNNE